MRGLPAIARLRSGFALVLVLAGGLGLAGCSDIDSALFGDEDDTSAAMAEPPSAGPAVAGTLPGMSAAPAPVSSIAPVATITPVAIEAGADTGTAVSKTVQSLRGQLSDIEGKLRANAQRLADLRNTSAGAAGNYQQAKAHIITRLQVGTTRGNPELVSEWNSAQTSLDSLTSNINALNMLGTDIAGDSSTTHFVLQQVNATLDVSGAVDEDHRQLLVLEDETNQTIVLVNRLLTEVSSDVQRQTAYVANERSNLTVLSSAIKNGELYGGDLGVPMAAAATNQMVASATPLVVIRFDQPNVDYQQILYAALNQALQNRPGADFEVVAISPTRGTAAAVQLAQTAAERHAQEVMRSMTDMGVPATRLSVAASTDPAASASEVRVFAR